MLKSFTTVKSAENQNPSDQSESELKANYIFQWHLHRLCKQVWQFCTKSIEEEEENGQLAPTWWWSFWRWHPVCQKLAHVSLSHSHSLLSMPLLIGIVDHHILGYKKFSATLWGSDGPVRGRTCTKAPCRPSGQQWQPSDSAFAATRQSWRCLPLQVDTHS